MSNLQPPHYESGALPIALLVLARVVGLEPTAPCSQIGTERFFELFPLNFGSFRSVPIAFCHSLNVLFPYTPHHTVAEAVVKNLAK